MAKDERASIFFDRQALRFVGLTSSVLSKLKETYKHVDVDSELEKMSFWLLSAKGCRRKGTITFITTWLNSCTPARSKPKDIPLENSSALEPYLIPYRKELWKGREHILRMNCLQAPS